MHKTNDKGHKRCINFPKYFWMFYHDTYRVYKPKTHTCTVKLGDKERFDKEQIDVKEPLVNLLHKD